MITDEQFMRRCIQLALMGKGNVAPNPLVGALIVLENKVIAEGYHQKYGEAHAEVNAIDAIEDKAVLSKSTLYVSLEPCAHFGKTPPCADLIVEHSFKRVVIGCYDTFDQVAGKGVARLKNAGIDVSVGVLENECRELNKHFFTFHEKSRPFVFLKWAQTAQGFMDDGDNNKSTQKITWISAPEVRSLTHQWRAEHTAILVGKNTIQNDNPKLTVREVDGKNPIRIILDTKASLNGQLKCSDEEGTTIILNTEKSEKNGPIDYIKIKDMQPKTILHELFKRNIQSVLIEGGAATLDTFIKSNLWDEACVITGQIEFESGTRAPKLAGDYTTQKHFGDLIHYYRNT
ncbi:MAG: bifunctional diaminohydroxyphosphoribosylaminopyrimidine deaminase/5-amino-6-(5-phosphoribosylamino)uracil reductase RibD [Crocinitomicaceae bacterium]|nr:bifunctional diaminohydroxyphosphoribosylaminopyrimidine deaminase/5-amino-6-(5-phosphoribosylamino)uracil reductase RibD [Crocinitomicaceae bacterium]MDG1741325.1 bifunctional diaminohydroxyphosphoribosylaminopyrimidine deaminase/5-amino-6-(5-phosphoribosylamino)uracil reductase RibD [Crocinitomicaceae bacterium]